MAVRSNVQKPYDASSAIVTMAKKFVTVERGAPHRCAPTGQARKLCVSSSSLVLPRQAGAEQRDAPSPLTMNLTQEQFATGCQLHGLDISRGTVSQIEAQIRCVNDSELFLLASVLGVSTESLYPANFKKTKRLKNK
jgi:hypothetical protein